MKKYIIFLILIIVSINSFAQKIDTDIFDNLKYLSKDGVYKSYLKRSIFDDLIFSDNMGNKITLKKKYIELKYGKLENKEMELDILTSMTNTYRPYKNYKATYSVDIFDETIIKNNRNGKVEEKKTSKSPFMKRNLNGTFKYDKNNENATFKKEFNNWIYEDSSGTKIKFNNKTFRKLKNKFGTEEKMFNYLIYSFLHVY